MTNLSTTYLGLKLKSPIVVSAGPLCKDLGNIKKMEDAGAAAIVLHSLFEEQINAESLELDRFLSRQTDSYAESLNYFPDMGRYNIGPDAYLFEALARIAPTHYYEVLDRIVAFAERRTQPERPRAVR